MILVAVTAVSLANAFQTPLSLVAQLQERAGVMLFSKIFAVYNLVADIFLIHFFGIWGAVVAYRKCDVGKKTFSYGFLSGTLLVSQGCSLFMQ